MSSYWRKKSTFLLAAVLMLGEGIIAPESAPAAEIFEQDFSEMSRADTPGDEDPVYDEAEAAGEIPYVMPSMEEMEAWIIRKYGDGETAVSDSSGAELLFDEDPEVILTVPAQAQPEINPESSPEIIPEEELYASGPFEQPADTTEAFSPEELFSDSDIFSEAVQDQAVQEDSGIFTSAEDEPDGQNGLPDAALSEGSAVQVPDDELLFPEENLQSFPEDSTLVLFENEPFFSPEEEEPFFSPEEDAVNDDILSMIVADDGMPGSFVISPSGLYTLEVKNGDDITIPLNYLIQSVRDTASDDHPVTIVIPPGSYDLTGTISLYSNMTLKAEGATVTKRNSVKQILMRLGQENEVTSGGYDGFRNIVIDGGTWDLNYAVISEAVRQEAGGYVGFRLGHVTNLTVRNVHFRNNLKSHFLELAGAKNVYVTGCSFSGWWEGYVKGGQECIQLDACLDGIFPGCLPYDGTTCEHVIIEDNTFSHVFAGVGAHSMVFGVPYHDIQIRRNTFYDVRKRSVWCMNFTDSVVEDNTMDDVGGGVDADSGHSSNVHVLPGAAPCSPYTLHTNVLIQNNQITLGERRTLVNYDGQVSTWNPYGIRVTGLKYASANEAHDAGKFPIADVTVRGNLISGSAGGILLTLASHCTVSGNTLELFYPDEFKNQGISLCTVTDSKVSGNRVSDAKGNGIWLYTSSTGNVIESNRLERNGGCGICLASSGSNRILGNTAIDNVTDGIQIGSSSKVTLQKNNLVSNGRHGLYLSSAKSCTVSGGKAVDNQGRGISLSKAASNTISQTTVQGNVGGGIGLSTSSISNKLSSNTVTGNEGDGILVSSSNSNTLTSNTVSKNRRYGIYLYQSKNLALISNRADANASAGIFASSSGLASFQKNTAFSNKTYGILGSSSVFSRVSANKTCYNGKTAQIYMKKCTGMATMNKPVSLKITKATTVFKGKAVGAVKIFIYRQAGGKNTRLMSGTVSKNNYSIKGKKLKKGTTLLLLAKDKNGNESRALTKVV